MEFLADGQLTRKMIDLASSRQVRKMAIAYWGADALKLMKIDPRDRKVKCVCCLQNGKSDPSVIKKFGSRAPQADHLHAKIIWTPRGAIVGSANASSNGLPEEEFAAKGLIEAGFYTTDSKQLKSISVWFDHLFNKRARKILKSDLEAAEAARRDRLWSADRHRGPKRELVKSLQLGNKLEFLQQRIYLIKCDETMTPAAERKAKAYLRQNKAKIEKKLVLDRRYFSNLTYYQFPGLPEDAFIIELYKGKRGYSVSGPFKTFSVPSTWRGVSYVLHGRRFKFPYDLSSTVKIFIALAGNDIW
jgi:hypothetical protein